MAIKRLPKGQAADSHLAVYDPSLGRDARVHINDLADELVKMPQFEGLGSGGTGGTPIAPVIVTQPQSQSVASGQTVNLFVVATGTGTLTYQWRLNGVDIAGATSSSYAAAVVGNYTVAVTNSVGTTVSASAAVTITGAGTAPSIVTHPQPQTISAGQTATLTVVAAGTTPLSYQWRRNNVAITGATASSYGATLEGDYNVVVTNAAGSATSNVATITVSTASAPVIVTQPQSQTIQAGQIATLTVAATGSVPMNFQWRRDGVNISGGSVGSNFSSYDATLAGVYTVVVSNIAGSVTSASATVSVIAGSIQVYFGPNPEDNEPGPGAPGVAGGFQDTMLYSSAPATPQDNGAFATEGGGESRNIILQMNMPELAAAYVAANSGMVALPVTDARLELYQYTDTSTPVIHNIYLLAAAPNYPQATWNSRSAGNAWATPGGDLGELLGNITLGGAGGLKQSSNLSLPSSANWANGIIVVPQANTNGFIGVRSVEQGVGSQLKPRARLTLTSVGGTPPPPPPPPGGFAIGANYAMMADWAPKNTRSMVEQSRGFGAIGEFDENLSISRDANGWPLVAAQMVVAADSEYPGSEFETGVWKGRYVDNTGAAATMSLVAVANASVTNVVRTGNVVTFDCTITAAPTIIVSFSAGVRDFHIVPPGDDPANTGTRLRTISRDYWAQYYASRSLDYMSLNSTHANSEATWAARQPDNKLCGGRKSWKSFVDHFLEVRAAPNSKMNTIWPNMPFRFKEADCLGMAQLFASMLPAGVIKMPEFANELWNPIYGAQWNYFLDIATNSSNPDYARVNTPSTTDQWQRMARAWALMAARMAKAWKQTFPGEFGATLKPILASQFGYGNLYWMNLMWDWLSLAPQIAEFGAPAQLFYAVSGATYSGGTESQMAIPTTAVEFVKSLDGDPTAATLFTYNRVNLVTSTDPLLPGIRLWKQFADSKGVKFIAYETGVHTHDSQNRVVKMAAHLHASMQQHVVNILQGGQAEGCELMMWLSGSVQKYVDTNENSFSWPIAQGFQPANTTPKLLGLQQVLATL